MTSPREASLVKREASFVREWSCWFLVSGFMLSGNTLRKLETRNVGLETPERRFTLHERRGQRQAGR